ncbi:MAG: hypothetical protein HUK24_00115, partial [Sphaerochaetaceae bacterium]|nr:hypothetical protein [Sphaerochaetaceae bacterium]
YQIDTNDKAHKVFWPQDFEDKLENIEERYNICRLNPEPSNSSDPSYRNIDEYPQIELKNIISLVLQEKGSLSKDEIIYEVARKMGYERCGALIVATLTKVLEELCENSNCI